MTTPRHTETHRTCYRCEKLGRPAVHPVAEFTRRSNGTYFSACRACNREMGAERRAAKKMPAGFECPACGIGNRAKRTDGNWYCLNGHAAPAPQEAK